MPEPLPLKPTTVRFAEDGMELVQRAADKVGCNFGQFCREAALMRAVIVLGGEQEMARLDEEVRTEGNVRVKRLARRNDPDD